MPWSNNVKRFKKGLSWLILISVISVLPCSCVFNEKTDEPVERTVLVYIGADNDLVSNAFINLNDIKRAVKEYAGQSRIVVFLDAPGRESVLFQINRNSVDTLLAYGKQLDSTDPEVLKSAIDYVINNFESDSYGLVMWSHGTGWLPGSKLHALAKNYGYIQRRGGMEPHITGDLYDYYFNGTKTFALEGKQGEFRYMELDEMADAIPNNTFDYIVFDACFMSNVEVAYALRNKCRYFVGSAYEIVGSGFPYRKITSHLLNGNLIRVCHGFYDYYNSMSGWTKMGGIAIIRTDKLEALAGSFSKIVQNSKDIIHDLDLDKLDEEEAIQFFDCFNHHAFYDLEALADYICDDDELMKEFKTSLQDCVMFSKSTDCIFKGKRKYDSDNDPQYEIKIKSYCGLSVFIPAKKYDTMGVTPEDPLGLNEEYRKTEWSIATGY